MAVEEVVGHSAEGFAFFAERFEGVHGFVRQAFGFGLGFGHAEDRWVGRFFCFQIFPGALAELLAGLSNIENIVNHLKGQTESGSELRQGSELLRCGIGRHGTETD